MLNIFSELFSVNAATLSGCIDIIVVKQQDGTLVSSPFHVRFGKLKVLKASDKHVTIHVNNQETDLVMKLGSAGEAFFVHQTTEELLDREDLRTSPLMSPTGMSPRNAAPQRGTAFPAVASGVNYSSDGDNDPVSNDVALGQKLPDQVTLKADEVMAAVNDIAELEKKISHEEEANLLAQQQEDEMEEEKVDINLLKQDPEAIEKFVEAEYQRELLLEESQHQQQQIDSQVLLQEEVKETSSLLSQNLESQKAQQSQLQPNQQQQAQKYQSRWRWLWGQLPEKDNISSELQALQNMQSKHEEVKKPQEDMIDKEVPSQTVKEVTENQPLQQPETQFQQPQQIAASLETSNPQLQPQKVLQNTAQGGFFRSVFSYFGKGGAKQESELKKQESSHSLPGGDSSANFESISQPNQLVNTPRAEDEGDEASEIDMSLCGHIICDQSITGGEVILNAFEEHRITYEQFCQNPHELLRNPNLVIRIEDQYYNWETAAPFIISMLAFKQPIANEIVGQPLVVVHQIKNQQSQNTLLNSVSPQMEVEGSLNNENLQQVEDESGNNQKKQPLQIKSLENVQATAKNSSSSGESSPQAGKQEEEKGGSQLVYTKSLTPTEDQLNQLNLKMGVNDISFTVQSIFQGEQTIKGRIFLWDYEKKIVISDVDGTITRSDMLGHVLPRLGQDWSHQGIAKLYTGIKKNGYEFLYLSSRPIGQADLTRDYIRGIIQDQFMMPDGPVILSPDRLIRSFKREIIHRQPQMFKIAALKNIRNLFPDDYNPFYCGFGNRDTDAVSYRAVGISLNRIFIINHDGEIHHYNSTYKKSYPLLTELVDDMFPTIIGELIAGAEEIKDLTKQLFTGSPAKKASPKPQDSQKLKQKLDTENDDNLVPQFEDEEEFESKSPPQRLVFRMSGTEEGDHHRMKEDHQIMGKPGDQDVSSQKKPKELGNESKILNEILNDSS